MMPPTALTGPLTLGTAVAKKLQLSPHPTTGAPNFSLPELTRLCSPQRKITLSKCSKAHPVRGESRSDAFSQCRLLRGWVKTLSEELKILNFYEFLFPRAPLAESGCLFFLCIISPSN